MATHDKNTFSWILYILSASDIAMSSASQCLLQTFAPFPELLCPWQDRLKVSQIVSQLFSQNATCWSYSVYTLPWKKLFMKTIKTAVAWFLICVCAFHNLSTLFYTWFFMMRRKTAFESTIYLFSIVGWIVKVFPSLLSHSMNIVQRSRTWRGWTSRIFP